MEVGTGGGTQLGEGAGGAGARGGEQLGGRSHAPILPVGMNSRTGPGSTRENRPRGGTGMTDEQQIRDLIERWATAVHDGDLPAVLPDHAPGIVMFDVPPPEQGVRGIESYRSTRPGFFEWQPSGAVFEIESLDVTASPGQAPAMITSQR